MRKTGIVVVLCAGVALVFPGGTTVAIAQLAPDAPSRADPAQETDTVVLPRRSTGRTVVRVGVPRVESPPANLRLSLDGFRVENNPRVAADEIERVLAPWRGRELSFPEFEEAVHALATYLRENGHPNAEVQVSRDLGRTAQIAIANLTAAEPRPPTIEVRSFAVDGVTVASADEIQGTLRPWTGRALTVAELQEATEAVAAHLRNKGFPLAQAFLPQQRVDGGTIRIAVQEGIVDGSVGRGGLTVEQSGARVRPEVVETILARGVTAGKPLDGARLERALRIAGDLPGIESVRANLAPGTEPGTTQVQTTVTDGRLLTGAVWADNHGSVYSGAQRSNLLVNLNSPLGYGEQFSLSGMASGRSQNFKFGVQAPVGSDGMRLGASVSTLRVDVGRELAPLNLNSRTTVFSTFTSYPVWRGADVNLNVGGNLDYKIVTNDLLGQPESDRRIPMATGIVAGDFYDTLAGRSVWSASASVGDLDLSNNASFALRDAVSARTEGMFGKLNLAYSRTQPLSADGGWFWYAGASGQVSSKNLDSVEKFQLGGPSGVRAYPVGEGLGDHGFLASAEIHRRLFETGIGPVHAFGLFDVGGVRQYDSLWTNALREDQPNGYTLAGYGLGLSLTSDLGNLNLTWARKVGNNPNTSLTGADADGNSRDSRIWILGTIRY
jgi:hemolysin activation/secretion protein